MSSYDRNSRLKTHLRTADGFYDQGFAVSQGIINASFEKLWKKYTAAQVMTLDVGFAQMEGEMLSSRILIPKSVGLDLSKVIHQIRFKTGRMTSVHNPNPVKLDNFVIGVVCDLDLQFVKPAHEGETEEERKWREFIEREFDVPGDYRLERLYSKLTSGNWTHFDRDNSQYFDEDGKPMTYAEWLRKDQASATLFSAVLSSWAFQMEAEGLSTLGLSITLPDLPPEETPTFTPTKMIHQIMPYRDSNDQSDQGDNPMGNANSLLYLEVVKDEHGNDGKPPNSLQVGYAGNFCYPSLGNAPGVDGTFLLSSQLFMGRFLLPHFQCLNEASSIYVEAVRIHEGGGWSFPTQYGSDPNYDEKHEVYKFKKSSDGRNWEYKKDLDESHPVEKHNNPGWWWTSDHWSKASTVVSWQPGSELRVKVEGSYEYYRGIAFAQNAQMQNPPTYSKERYTGKWNVEVIMPAKDGRLALELISQENLNFTTTGWADTSPDLEPYKQNEYVLRDYIKDTILTQLKILRENLKKGFKGTHQFVFPGTGQLEFIDSTFNNQGDILAEVTWREPEGDGPVIVRPDGYTDVNKLEPYVCLHHNPLHMDVIPDPRRKLPDPDKSK